MEVRKWRVLPWIVVVASTAMLSGAPLAPAYAAGPNGTVGGGGGSQWTQEYSGGTQSGTTFYEYECDSEYGCYPIDENEPEVSSYWEETWSGDDTGSAELDIVCMWGYWQNPNNMPLALNLSFSESSGSTAWSGTALYSNSCNTIYPTSWQAVAGDNYPAVTFTYPGSVSTDTVTVHATDNLVSPQSQPYEWAAGH